jgi:Ca2+/H+ antiporter, TMEM165/GDT1 family
METRKQGGYGPRKWIFLPLMLIGMSLLITLVMLLWNWLMPAIFHLGTLSFWQAGGLLLLSRILFGSFHFRNHRDHKKAFSRHGLHHKLMQMNDEERDKFRQEWRQRCGM